MWWISIFSSRTTVFLSLILLVSKVVSEDVEDYDQNHHDNHPAASESDVDITNPQGSGSYGYGTAAVYGAPTTFVVEQQAGAPVVQVPIPYGHSPFKGLKFGGPPGWGWPGPQQQFPVHQGPFGGGWGLPFPPQVVFPFPSGGWGWPGPFRR